MTRATATVLQALLDAGEPVYGFELLRSTGLKSGTLYPLLDRLQTNGLLTSEWEDVDAKIAGRPRRRFYRLTGLGQHEAHRLMLEAAAGGTAWVG